MADGLRLRGFAGLPDGSAWLVDEIAWAVAYAGPAPSLTGAAAAGEALARRMRSAGAAELLRDAEAMVT